MSTDSSPLNRSATPLPSGPKPKLLDQLRDAARNAQCDRRVEDAYVQWVRRFILFHGLRHPSEMGQTDVAAFLKHLAVSEHASWSVQAEVQAAIRFLYENVVTRSDETPAPPVSRGVPHEPPTPETVAAESMGPKLLDRVSAAIQTLHYSRRTDQSYQHWIRRFILFHKKRHPSEMAEPEVNQFLSHLAVNEHVAASTQNQALAALLFLYQHVLAKPLGRIEGVVRAKRPKRLPVVLTADEMRHMLQHMQGVPHLICRLLYGSGLRLLECMRLRVKDIDFQKNEITVRDGKGQKDRVTMLPAVCKQELLDHLKQVREQHAEDLKHDLGRAPLPFALARKYKSADREWGWQYVFPATTHYLDRETGNRYRHHFHESVIQKAMHEAVRLAGLAKPATPHSLRHSFATELILAGYDIRTVAELMGHKDIQTTMIYLHVLNRGGMGVRSPADRL